MSKSKIGALRIARKPASDDRKLAIPLRAQTRRRPDASARVSRAAAERARTAITPLKIFTARCEARALLWQTCFFDLHEAVDMLQSAAERDGLVDELGQDAVQAIIAETFEAVR
jgi:hypothetical protein